MAKDRDAMYSKSSFFMSGKCSNSNFIRVQGTVFEFQPSDGLAWL